jgi:hypothetical protein
MKIYFIILMLAFITNCRAGNTGGCVYNCNDTFWGCSLISIESSRDGTTRKLNYQLFTEYLAACNYMANQCFKRCDNNYSR